MASGSPAAGSAYVRELSARIKALEAELVSASKASRRSGSSRHDGRNRWAFIPASSEEGESWLLTYLDMLTLLLVMLLIMLSFAGSQRGVSGAPSEATLPQAGSPVGPGVLHGSLGVLPDGSLVPPHAEGVLMGDGPMSAVTAGLNQQPGQIQQGQPPGLNPLAGLDLSQLGEDIDVIISEKTVNLRISSEILFASGQGELSRAGLAVLQSVRHVLEQTDHRIAIEGHTDTVPIRSARYPSNWELSGARAGSVVRYLQSNGIAANRLRAVGYADTRPIADNATAEGRASNRRVELILEQPED